MLFSCDQVFWPWPLHFTLYLLQQCPVGSYMFLKDRMGRRCNYYFYVSTHLKFSVLAHPVLHWQVPLYFSDLITITKPKQLGVLYMQNSQKSPRVIPYSLKEKDILNDVVQGLLFLKNRARWSWFQCLWLISLFN